MRFFTFPNVAEQQKIVLKTVPNLNVTKAYKDNDVVLLYFKGLHKIYENVMGLDELNSKVSRQSFEVHG